MYYANPLSMMQQALVAMPGGRPAPAAPTYYGPMHQQLSDYFNAGANWRADFPRYVNQLMFDPDLRNMHGGFNSRAVSYEPHNDWRIDWFAEDRAKAAAAAANAAAAPVNAGLLYQAWGVRPGENDIPSASADGATGNSGGGVGGTGGVGGNSSAGTSDGPGGGGGG